MSLVYQAVYKYIFCFVFWTESLYADLYKTGNIINEQLTFYSSGPAITLTKPPLSEMLKDVYGAI